MTVTPFSEPSCRRALHAALVIVVRHWLGLEDNDDAERFDPASREAREVVQNLKNRMLEACSTAERQQVEEMLEALLVEWANRRNRPREGRLRFVCQGGRQFRNCVMEPFRHGRRGDAMPWPTMNSMRQVDTECPLRVWGVEE